MSRILSNRLRRRAGSQEVEPGMIKLQRYFFELSGELIRRREATGLSIGELTPSFARYTGLTLGIASRVRIGRIENGEAFQDCYNSFGDKQRLNRIRNLSRDLSGYLHALGTPEDEALEFVGKVSEKIVGVTYFPQR